MKRFRINKINRLNKSRLKILIIFLIIRINSPE